MKKVLVIFITLIIFAELISSFGEIKVSAAGTVKRADLYFDESLAKEEPEYSPNTNILITPIFFPAEEQVNIDEWIQGLYYYSVVRLGYSDIPFHYIVDSDGNIYEVNKSGDEAKIAVEGIDKASVIIAYLAEEGDTDFSDQGKNALNTLSLETANRDSIESSNIQIMNLRFKVNLNTKISILEARQISGSWQTSFKKIKAYVQEHYKPEGKKYQVEIVKVKVPSGELKPGDIAIVEITLKNTGEYSIYSGSDSALLASKKDGKASKFFINNVWASQSQVDIFSEGDILRPGAEGTYQVKFKVPLYFGTQKEDFIIKDGLGNSISGTDFSVSLKVGNLNAAVIEILDTETGYLNVRSSDSGNAKVITRVSPGERFIQKETGRGGYVQIQLSDGELGWVSSKYIKRVN